MLDAKHSCNGHTFIPLRCFGKEPAIIRFDIATNAYGYAGFDENDTPAVLWFTGGPAEEDLVFTKAEYYYPALNKTQSELLTCTA